MTESSQQYSGIAELQLGNKPGWHSRGHLPHIDADGLIQHITFHLADSLPKKTMEQMEQSIAIMPENKQNRQPRERYQTLLDNGYGSCILREPELADLMQAMLLYFDGKRYRLLAGGW